MNEPGHLTAWLERSEGQPVEILRDAQVDVDGSAVRLMLTPPADKPVGHVFNLTHNRSLAGLVSD